GRGGAGLVAVDAGGGAGLEGGADRQRALVAAETERGTELAALLRGRRLQVTLLAPGATAAAERVGGTDAVAAVVGLVAVEAGGGTGFADRADDEEVAAAGQRQRRTEVVVGASVGGFQVGALGPAATALAEQIH